MHERSIYFIIFVFFTFQVFKMSVGAKKRIMSKAFFNIILIICYLFFFNVERIRHPTTAPIAIDTKYIGQLLTVAMTNTPP